MVEVHAANVSHLSRCGCSSCVGFDSHSSPYKGVTKFYYYYHMFKFQAEYSFRQLTVASIIFRSGGDDHRVWDEYIYLIIKFIRAAVPPESSGHSVSCT
jgi:hypothetical protein